MVGSLLLSMSCFAQDIAYVGNPDQSFFNARDLAFAGNRMIARDTLNHILTKYPEYTDVRNLLAKTLSWDGDYEKARKEFNHITSKERENKEVWVAAIKNESYAKEHHIALGLANKALLYVEDDADIISLKESIMKSMQTNRVGVKKKKNTEDIRKEFNRITSVDRKNKEAWVAAIRNELRAKEFHIALGLANKALTYLKKDEDLEVMKAYATLQINNKINKLPTTERPADAIEEAPLNNRLMVSNDFEVFDKVFESMIYTSIAYQRETKAGTIIPRINYNNRFQTHGIQYEMDFYPKFSKTFYGYLNYGYSESSIFPSHGVGGELYANLPKKIEASAGFRFLDFADTKVTIFTGSIGLYSGNYYMSLRPYITPNPNGSTGVSGNLLVRKYLKDGTNYLGLRAGMGFMPELKQLRSGDELLAETLLYVESQQLQFEYQFPGWIKSNLYKANLGITRQELIFDANTFFWAVSAGIQCNVAF